MVQNLLLKRKKPSFIIQDLISVHGENGNQLKAPRLPTTQIFETTDNGLLQLNTHVFDIALHPQQDLVVGGTIDGDLFCIKYGDNNNTSQTDVIVSDMLPDSFTPVFVKKQHNKSCRSVDFSQDGRFVFTCSKDRTLTAFDVEQEKTLMTFPKAHGASINKIKTLNEKLIATGDDNGVVKVWDIQKQSCIREYKENVDYITNFEFVSDRSTLFATSGDGCLSVFDVGTRKPIQVSENQDDELLSVCVMKNQSKVVVGTQEGVLEIFTWGQWLDCTDRFPGHKGSIDAMVKIDENTLVTACDDEFMRMISILSNKFIERVGSQEGHVECIRFDERNNLIVTSADDQSIQFFNLPETRGGDSDEKNEIEDEDDHEGHANYSDEEEDDEYDMSDMKSSRRKKKRTKAKKGIDKPNSRTAFFSGLGGFD